jgi:hypothetical protein
MYGCVLSSHLWVAIIDSCMNTNPLEVFANIWQCCVRKILNMYLSVSEYLDLDIYVIAYMSEYIFINGFTYIETYFADGRLLQTWVHLSD